MYSTARRLIESLLASRGFETRPTGVRRSVGVQRELRRLRKLPQGTPTQTNLLGKPLLIACPGTFETLYREIWERGVYRLPAGLSDVRALDLGANVGLATLCLKRSHPDASVVAVEPDPNIASMLRTNLETFGHTDVRVIEAAVSCNEGDSEIGFVPDRGGTGGRVDGDAGLRVKSIDLSSLIDGEITLMKMDIEGAEREVLPRSEHLLSKVSHLFIEYHARLNEPQTLSSLLSVLERAGFRYTLENGGPASRRPFQDRRAHKGYDTLVNIYASKPILESG